MCNIFKNNFHAFCKGVLLPLSFIVFTLSGCHFLDPCPECFSPPESFKLMILDTITGENLIKPGNFDPDSIRIYYHSGTQDINIDLEIFGDDSLRFIVSNQIGFISTGSKNTFFLELSELDTDTLYFKTRIISEDCCTWHETDQPLINGQTMEYNYDNYSWVLKKHI